MIDLGLFFLEKSLSEVFGRIKLHKKIFPIKRSILYYCVSTEQYLTYKVSNTNAVLQNLPLNR